MTHKTALIIFAKAPVPGQVKTRLIPAIGSKKAASLYKELLSNTLDIAATAGFPDMQLWVSGDIEHQYLVHLKNTYNVKLYQQTGEDLGQRMSNAFNEVLSKHSSTILIGSDCPSLLSSDLQSAKDCLESGEDVVLGPAEDGGYYLIGLNKNVPELFADIKWGGDTVFSETSSRIEKLNLTMCLLQKRRDLDCPSDLDLYYELKNEETVL